MASAPPSPAPAAADGHARRRSATARGSGGSLPPPHRGWKADRPRTSAAGAPSSPVPAIPRAQTGREQGNRARDDPPRGHPRVRRRHRVLKDHLIRRPPPLQRQCGHRRPILPLPQHLPRRHLGARLAPPVDQTARRRKAMPAPPGGRCGHGGGGGAASARAPTAPCQKQCRRKSSGSAPLCPDAAARKVGLHRPGGKASSCSTATGVTGSQGHGVTGSQCRSGR